jgi:hypothetical protein
MSAYTCILQWADCKQIGVDCNRDAVAVRRCYQGARVLMTTHRAVTASARKLGLPLPPPHYSTLSTPAAGVSSIHAGPKLSA